MKSFKQFQEAIALAPLAIPASKLIGAGLVATGLTGMVLQSRKKKEEKEDLLGAVRKKQDEIQQDVANKETLEKNKEFQKKEKDRGKYVRRKQKPENQFVGEGAAVLAAPAITNKVISTGAALWGMYNTINNQGPGIKDGSGTKKGGVWDNLPKGKSSNWSKGNNLTGIAKEVEKKRNKDILKKYIKDKYGNKDQLTGGTLPEEMMGAGAIVNNVGDGKIAGTVEAGDDPPKKKKKKRYVYGGKGSRKMWLT